MKEDWVTQKLRDLSPKARGQFGKFARRAYRTTRKERKALARLVRLVNADAANMGEANFALAV